MRPTELQFRSPKEKTAEFNIPVVTKEGTILLTTIAEKKRPTFAKGKRFPHYDDYAKLTGYRVGPGSYQPDNHAIGRAHVKGGHLYKAFHGNRDVTNNGYIFIGHQMLFDRSFILPSRKSPEKPTATPISQAKTVLTKTFQRISTASTPAKHRRSESSKPRLMSPNFGNLSFY